MEIKTAWYAPTIVLNCESVIKACGGGFQAPIRDYTTRPIPIVFGIERMAQKEWELAELESQTEGNLLTY